MRSRALAVLLVCWLAACGGSSDFFENLGSLQASENLRFAATPDPDPFYAEPDLLTRVPPGTVLKSEPVTFQPLGVPLPFFAWRLQYMSTDLNGDQRAATAVVVKPLKATASGKKPLLSYHFATDSVGLKCAPSHQVTGDISNPTSQLEGLLSLPNLLALGWTLIFPDYQGPDAAFGVGRLYAPIVLDGIRAAERFEPLELPGAETPVGMTGYSGGSIPSLWAAALQPDYAPELNLAGVAVGGAVPNLKATFKRFEGHPLFTTAFGVLIGINRVFPQLLPSGLLNARGVALAESIKDGCGGFTSSGLPGLPGRIADYVTVDDFFATPGAQEVFPELALPQPGEVPQTEIYFYHEILDELAPLAEVKKAATAWCDAGVRVHLTQDLTGNHIMGAALGTPPISLYLQSRFDEAPSPVLPLGTTTCN